MAKKSGRFYFYPLFNTIVELTVNTPNLKRETQNPLGDSMQTDTRLGTFVEVISGAVKGVQAIAIRLRQIIDEIHPDCVEVPRPGESAAAYGLGPKKMSEAYAYIMPQKTYVNLGFFYGASLSDPANLLEGSGKAMRHIKVYTLEQADNPEIRALLSESIQERKTALGRL